MGIPEEILLESDFEFNPYPLYPAPTQPEMEEEL